MILFRFLLDRCGGMCEWKKARRISIICVVDFNVQIHFVGCKYYYYFVAWILIHDHKNIGTIWEREDEMKDGKI